MNKIRNPREDEFEAVYDFVLQCHPLERYTLHFYRIILRYFRDTCFVVDEDKSIVGFAFGFFSQTNREIFFMWQIGISPGRQGQGIGSFLIEEIEKNLRNRGTKRIELTIDPKNWPSQRLFEKNGYTIISGREKDTIEVDNKTAVKDFYGKGRHFVLYGKDFTGEARRTYC